MEAVFAFYDPEIVWDQTRYGGAELANLYRGHDGIKQLFREWIEPFESYHAHAEEFIDAGEAVVVRCRQSGRGKQSGVEVEMPPYWQVYRVEDGLVSRITVYLNEADALNAARLRE
jgi:ketosteroid isomerase-like protein